MAMMTTLTHLKHDLEFLDMKTDRNRIATSCREDEDDAMQEQPWSFGRLGRAFGR
jgi:hypothetical protein